MMKQILVIFVLILVLLAMLERHLVPHVTIPMHRLQPVMEVALLVLLLTVRNAPQLIHLSVRLVLQVIVFLIQTILANLYALLTSALNAQILLLVHNAPMGMSPVATNVSSVKILQCA